MKWNGRTNWYVPRSPRTVVRLLPTLVPIDLHPFLVRQLLCREPNVVTEAGESAMTVLTLTSEEFLRPSPSLLPHTDALLCSR